MDSVVSHYILLVVVINGGQYRCRRDVRHRAKFLYDDDSLVALTNLVWLQVAFGTLTRLFDIVGFQKNIRKMVGMLFRPCHTAGTKSEAAYGQIING